MKFIMALTRSKIRRTKTTFSVTCRSLLCYTCLDLKWKRFGAGNGSSDCIYEVHSTEVVEVDNCYHRIKVHI